eukprot:Gb_17680 [translate_table: standard]
MLEIPGIVGIIVGFVAMLCVVVPGVVALKKCCQTNDLEDGKRAADSGTSSRGGRSDFAPLVQGRSVNGSEFILSHNSSLSHLPQVFNYGELEEATNNFSPANLVGEGGFGHVYRGTFNGKLIAVKRLKASTNQGEREFQTEVEVISRIHHRHLVRLVGYCIADGGKRLLVYEFLPNDTLQKHLHGEGMPTLDWPARLKIATGVGRGLAYLHADCDPRIIHRDIKSSNILLDEKFEAKLSDFGLAKLIPDAFSHVSTLHVMGARGYLAPEYALSGQLTEKLDVFSFGVVLLELITGRKPLDDNKMRLDKWAEPLLRRAKKEGKLDGLVDQRLGIDYNVSEMMQMVAYASAGVRSDPSKRPRMVEIVSAFDVHSRIDLNEESGDSSSVYSETSSPDLRILRKVTADLRKVPEERALP